LLQNERGEWLVLEVNAVPGWRALAPACGVDVAAEIVRHIAEGV
jgi:ribosomal protein S6--L-glutamate ligase